MEVITGSSSDTEVITGSTMEETGNGRGIVGSPNDREFASEDFNVLQSPLSTRYLSSSCFSSSSSISSYSLSRSGFKVNFFLLFLRAFSKNVFVSNQIEIYNSVVCIWDKNSI